jgi:8-oxo-dGTP pyrophosphatase MutT (NUDIX family)
MTIEANPRTFEILLPGPSFPDSPVKVSVEHCEWGKRHQKQVHIESANGRDGVVIVARDPLHRSTVGQNLWEFPRGFGSHPDPTADARRELHEETGATAKAVLKIGHFFPDSGLLSGKVWVVRAWVASSATRPTDPHEIQRVAWWTKDQLEEGIRSGVLRDAMTLSAYVIDSLAPHP